MGTRGAYGFHVGGVDKIAYSQHDSYPSGLGASMVDFVRGHTDEELCRVAEALVLVRQETPPTEDEIERYRRWADLRVSSRSLTEWYCLLRLAQGKPEAWFQGLDRMLDSSDFLADSLFCAWAWILNINARVLEVHRGFNENPEALGRYAALKLPEDTPRALSNRKYCGVRLLEAIPFVVLRDLSPAGVQGLLDRLDADE